jgi:phosphoglycolate phosphatase
VGGAVLFDLDGCLVDSRRGIVASFRHVLAQAGLPDREPEELERFIGPPLAYNIQELSGLAAGSAENDALVAEYRRHYDDQVVPGSELYAGIPEALDALRAAGHVLGIATSRPARYAHMLVDAFGLTGAFAHVEGTAMTGRSASKTTLIATALQALGTTRGAMVGDRRFDVEGGAANGLPTVGALWGFGSRDELTAAGATVLAAAPAELPGLVAGLAL